MGRKARLAKEIARLRVEMGDLAQRSADLGRAAQKEQARQSDLIEKGNADLEEMDRAAAEGAMFRAQLQARVADLEQLAEAALPRRCRACRALRTAQRKAEETEQADRAAEAARLALPRATPEAVKQFGDLAKERGWRRDDEDDERRDRARRRR